MLSESLDEERSHRPSAEVEDVIGWNAQICYRLRSLTLRLSGGSREVVPGAAPLLLGQPLVASSSVLSEAARLAWNCGCGAQLRPLADLTPHIGGGRWSPPR